MAVQSTTNLQDTGSHSTIYGRQEWTRAIGWWWLKGATIHRKQNTNEQKQNTTNYDKQKEIQKIIIIHNNMTDDMTPKAAITFVLWNVYTDNELFHKTINTTKHNNLS